MLKVLITGLLLGLPAGISPGPTVALVISETITRGVKHGVSVALAPLVTDPPIILFSLIIVGKLAQTSLPRASIDILGALYIAYLVWHAFLPNAEGEARIGRTIAPFWKGVLLNAVNPNPYIFWFTVGAPMIVQVRAESPTVNTAAFITGFYTAFIGSKVTIAAIAGESRRFVSDTILSRMSKLLTLTMLIFAGLLLWDALMLLTGRVAHSSRLLA